MNFELDPELADLQTRVRRFVDEELLPLERELASAEVLPQPLFEQLRARTKELGLWMYDIPKEHGGQGLGLMAKTIVLAEIGRQIAVPWRNQSIFGPFVAPILYQLDDEQRERYLYPVLRCEKIGCFAQTEPGAGSDPSSMTTSAVRDGDEYVINGHKWFIGWGDVADFIQLVCVTDPEKGARGGLSVLLVDMDTPGVRQHPAARRGQRDVPGGPPQQPDAERRLQRGQRARDGRLGDAEVDRGVGEAARVHDGDQAAQLPQLHIHNSSV